MSFALRAGSPRAATLAPPTPLRGDRFFRTRLVASWFRFLPHRWPLATAVFLEAEDSTADGADNADFLEEKKMKFEQESAAIVLKSLISTFVASSTGLNQWVASQFPKECVVRVDNPRFKGFGIVWRNDECPPDRLPVLVESGNVWWYELDTICERVRDVRKWPRWIKEKKIAWLRHETLRRTLDAQERPIP